MSEAVYDYFLFNSHEYKVTEFDGIYKNIHPSVYEVIRIIDGVPVFLEEHYDRLNNSTKLTGYKLNISFKTIKSEIQRMIKLNNIKNYNIKIVLNSLDSPKPNIYFFFIKSTYPTEEMYKNGVVTFLYTAERENPHAKVINQNLRDNVNKLLKDKNCFEALLVNTKNQITEGSRSNTFFIKGSKVFTAPASDVLLGITRQRIIRLCMENGIEVVESPIEVKELNLYEAAFISGTSPKVLPISKIDDIELSVSNFLLMKIMDIYNREIENYLKSNK